ncbi:MAG: hypothetical protein RQ745_12915 [Longimicrobiales bacterium]|nr:hypothetical protein [Longimicrobiales bacterium]
MTTAPTLNPLLLAVLAFGLALLAGALLTPMVRGAAYAAGLVRGAQDDRWHRRPTPAIGGVAIYLAFVVATALLYLIAPGVFRGSLGFVPERAWIEWPASQGLLLAATVAFGVGLVDDIRPMRPLVKLAGQLVAASILILSGIGVWLTGIEMLDMAISILWFVGVANALNLLDNMDGVAAGVAAIAAACLALLFALEGQVGFLLIALAFAGALVGFLAHNYPPARIFMGDSGSLFLGIFLAGLALAPAEGLSRSLVAAVAAPALLLAIPILDTTLVTVSRLLEGRPISTGGTDHTSHRLVALGVSEKRAMWLLWGLAATGGAIGILLRTAARDTALLLGGGMVVFLVVLGAYLLSVRLRPWSSAEEEASTPLHRVVLALHARLPVGVLLLDGLLIVLVYYAAYVIRWDQGQLPAELAYFRDSVVLVVSIKLLVLSLSGAYLVRWQSFSLGDAARVARAAILAAVAAVAALVLVDRVGLSRGVMIFDAILSTVALVGLRLSFRWFEGTTRTLGHAGVPTVVFGPASKADLMLRVLEMRHGEDENGVALRAVAVADPDYPRLRARTRGMPLFGTPNAAANALQETGASALLVVSEERGAPIPAPITAWLKEHGAVDLYRMEISVERFLDARPGSAERVARSGS